MLVAMAASLLHKEKDSETYTDLAAEIKDAFNQEFWDDSKGEYKIRTQTALSCALYMGLVEYEQEGKVAEELVKLVEENGWEYAERTRVSGIVAIVAVTRKGDVLLTEQYRPPVKKNVIELPAGWNNISQHHPVEVLTLNAFCLGEDPLELTERMDGT